MLVVHVSLKIKTGESSAFLDATTPIKEQIQLADGCRTYTWYQSLDDDDTYILYEEWDSEAQFDTYKASDLFTQAQQALLPFVAGKPESSYFRAELIT